MDIFAIKKFITEHTDQICGGVLNGNIIEIKTERRREGGTHILLVTNSRVVIDDVAEDDLKE